MNPVVQNLPLVYSNRGRWTGAYTFVDVMGVVLDQYNFDIDCEFPEDEPEVHYRQSSHYDWPDGRTQDLVFEACYEDRVLVWDNGRIAGRMWEIDDETIYLTFRFIDDPAVHVTEMIQMSPCRQHRARTWHWFRDHILFQRTLVHEARVPG